MRDWTKEQIHWISQGLSVENAIYGWHSALDSLLNDDGDFGAHLTTDFYSCRIAIVMARGVFTAGLEWVALALASGGSVHVKLPTGFRTSIAPWRIAFKNVGLPLTFGDEWDIPPVDLLWVFGDDNSIDTILTIRSSCSP